MLRLLSLSFSECVIMFYYFSFFFLSTWFFLLLEFSSFLFLRSPRDVMAFTRVRCYNILLTLVGISGVRTPFRQMSRCLMLSNEAYLFEFSFHRFADFFFRSLYLHKILYKSLFRRFFLMISQQFYYYYCFFLVWWFYTTLIFYMLTL